MSSQNQIFIGDLTGGQTDQPERSLALPLTGLGDPEIGDRASPFHDRNPGKNRRKQERLMGFEPTTITLATDALPTELQPHDLCQNEQIIGCGSARQGLI